MNDQYEWMKFYEAAVLETDPVSLPRRIKAAQYAIGQRVIKLNVDDSERREIIRTLNALSLLKRERCWVEGWAGGYDFQSLAPLKKRRGYRQ
jgi:hypothetical protein